MSDLGKTLRMWRERTARWLGVAPGAVLSNEQMQALAQRPPLTAWELYQCVGERSFKQHGAGLLHEVRHAAHRGAPADQCAAECATVARWLPQIEVATSLRRRGIKPKELARLLGWEEADVTLLSQPRFITTAAAQKLGANPLRNAAYRTRPSPVKCTWSPGGGGGGGGCCGSIRRPASPSSSDNSAPSAPLEKRHSALLRPRRSAERARRVVTFSLPPRKSVSPRGEDRASRGCRLSPRPRPASVPRCVKEAAKTRAIPAAPVYLLENS
ncbi:hypothetical protein DIPPA_09862 [Diplonema papillatum]|nr:hypothetical protein DIPPA_09862 [Diplonema papillatum]|eukprot:gene671-1028_t